MTCNAQRAVPPLIALAGVTKRFGSVTANDDVTFSIGRGDVVALVGENGAGKSTIVNMLAGLLMPDDGTIEIDGRPVRLATPGDSVAAGIGVVHQHFMLVPTMTGLENVALAVGAGRYGRLDRPKLRERIGQVAGVLGFTVELDTRVEAMDVAQQQRLEIVKALMHDVRLLVLDEPTAVLGPEDRDQLFAMITRLKAAGTATILITHKLEDVFAVADRAVVLRAGRLAHAAEIAELTAAQVVAHMMGVRDTADTRGIVTGATLPRAQAGIDGEPGGPVLCALRDVTLRRADGSVAVEGLSFDLHAGEIIAVAGVEGNGQSELMRALAGMDRPAFGVIACLGERSDGAGWSPARVRRLGVAHVPEDRRRCGIVGTMTLARNHLLRHTERSDLVRFGVLDLRRLDAVVAERIAAFDVRCAGPGDRMQSLSGGNQQKAVLARELDCDPAVILAAYPTRGLDIRTIQFVHQRLDEVRSAGKAVILVSSDLDEVMRLADRIVVLAGGRAFGPARADTIGHEALGAWIAGHSEVAS